MKSVQPSTLVKSQTPDIDEVEIWRRFNRMSKSQQSEVMDRIINIDDPNLKSRASKLLRAAYVV
jgi:hypothetical protein